MKKRHLIQICISHTVNGDLALIDGNLKLNYEAADAEKKMAIAKAFSAVATVADRWGFPIPIAAREMVADCLMEKKFLNTTA